jgi:hypothetical protein
MLSINPIKKNNMNYKTTLRIIVTGLLFGFSITDASAQVVQKIGQNSFTINPKAVLELESTSKGFLPPRMSASNQSAMGTSLPDGLVVFITDGSASGLQIWKGNKWIAFVDTEALSLKANLNDLDGLATTEATNKALALKADVTALALKANTSDLTGLATTEAMNTALALKANTSDLTGLATTEATNTALALKADVTALALKANTSDLTGLATTEATNTALALKADVTALALKANTSDLTGLATTEATNTALALKADVTALALKANTSDLTGLATTEAMNTVLVLKANTADLTAEAARATAIEVKLTTDKENAVNKSASITLASNSDIKFPTEKAVIDYVDIKISTISIAKHTSDYTALASDNTILCDTSGTTFKLSLPEASGASGKIYVIRKTDSSNNELTFSALILVDGSTVTTLNYPKTLRVQSDGSAWYVID